MIKASCHPDKRHCAKGLCYNCYYRMKRRTDPVFRAKAQKKSRESYKRNPGKKREYSKRWALERPEWMIRQAAKDRAKRKGLEFNLDLTDIIIPSVCPVLGIPIQRSTTGKQESYSPSLDRIDNLKGYIKGNVLVVSQRANQVKGDGTLDELRKIVDFYSALQ